MGTLKASENVAVPIQEPTSVVQTDTDTSDASITGDANMQRPQRQRRAPARWNDYVQHK